MLQGVHVTYDTPFPRRDLLGIHPQKQVRFIYGSCAIACPKIAERESQWLVASVPACTWSGWPLGAGLDYLRRRNGST